MLREYLIRLYSPIKNFNSEFYESKIQLILKGLYNFIEIILKKYRE